MHIVLSIASAAILNFLLWKLNKAPILLAFIIIFCFTIIYYALMNGIFLLCWRPSWIFGHKKNSRREFSRNFLCVVWDDILLQMSHFPALQILSRFTFNSTGLQCRVSLKQESTCNIFVPINIVLFKLNTDFSYFRLLYL